MAVGFPVKDDYATGDVLTAANMNDFAGTLNTVITPLGNAAGKNKVINGDFGIWQRGTTFTSPASGAYTSDRWLFENNGTGTATITREAFTPGAAPVAGYESSFFLRLATTAVGTSTTYDITQRIENVTTFANQTVTFSFFAKADSARTVTPIFAQNFGSGGSGAVFITGSAITLTTSWARYTQTLTIPSISGKTIGANNFLRVFLRSVPAASSVIDYWGWQVEAGSVATPFQTATGTIQGELAACMRYYEEVPFRCRGNDGSTDVIMIFFKATKRVNPTSTIVVNSGTTPGIGNEFVTGVGITLVGTPYDTVSNLKSSAEL
jgi:hypothetical protein